MAYNTYYIYAGIEGIEPETIQPSACYEWQGANSYEDAVRAARDAAMEMYWFHAQFTEYVPTPAEIEAQCPNDPEAQAAVIEGFINYRVEPVPAEIVRASDWIIREE